MTNISNCPCCGGTANLAYYVNADNEKYSCYVVCSECGLRTKAIIRQLNAQYPKIVVNVNVDGGGVGAGVVDELESNHSDLKYKVIEQTFGGQGGTLNEEPIKYSNNTGLLWGNVRRLLMADKLWLAEDNTLIKQLSTRKYSVDEDGHIKLERKQEMKKRNEESPDRADALSLSLGTNISHFTGMLDY